MEGETLDLTKYQKTKVSCHFSYSYCLSNGTTYCACDRDETEVLEAILKVIKSAKSWIEINDSFYRNLLRNKQKHSCIYRDAVIKGLEGMIKCFSGACSKEELRKYCPEKVICGDENVRELYRTNGQYLKHPDILIIRTENFTMIVERKKYGKQNYSDFRDQIESSYNYLPKELYNPCTFVVYAPEGGGTLPEGYQKHPQLHLLGSTGRKRLVIYPIPVLVVETSLLRSMR